MKHLLRLLLIALLFTSCEDVIDVDLPQATPRLSIDGLVRLDTSQTITTVTIKANITSSFFDENSPAELTTIFIQNLDYTPSSESDTQILLLSEVTPGVYEGSKSTEFFTEGELNLTIEHENQSYVAKTRYVTSAPISSLTQGDGVLFSGDETEVEIAFDDNANQENFYLFDLDFGDYLVSEDEFYDGQTFRFSYFYDEEVTDGMEIKISLLGVDETFYNYMNQLIVLAGGDQGPFQTPSATVKGNIINVTDANSSENFALGYFAVCQTSTSTIVIE